MDIHWPPNPGNNYIAGRPATQGDVASASATFVIAGDDGASLGTPIEIGVPRVVYIGEGATRQKATVIQAERAPNGAAMLGLLLGDGSTSVVSGPEVDLAERCVGYFNDDAYTIDSFQAGLAGGNAHIQRNGDTLAYWFDESPATYITLQRGPSIQDEATQVGAESEYAEQLRECNARIEITFDDLEEVLDEINTLIFLQQTFQDELGGIIYLSWNGGFIGPDG